jgi:secondary thiamine-phosphate synthase enzyme
MIHEIHLQSKHRDEMIDITAQVEKLLVQENVQEGLLVVYSSHTTAGVMINENADPAVQWDILRRLGEIAPHDRAADRHREGNSATHLKAGLTVLGNISVGGAIERAVNFADKVTILSENGAKNVIVPIDNLNELSNVPPSVLGNTDVPFYQNNQMLMQKAILLD